MKVIFNGDDFGFSRGCNYAILDCFKEGLLRSTSLMVNMPGADHAVELMKENPDLSVGLHLNLTVGYPLTDVPTLIKPDGLFNKGMLKDSEGISREEMAQEMQAQLDRFVALTGKLPDHINSHHGLEQVKYGLELMKELANRYNLPMRGYIYDSNIPVEGVPFKTVPMFMPTIKGPVQPEDVIGWLESQADDAVVEVPGHPGYVDQVLLDFSSLTTGRIDDAAMFNNPKLKAWIEQNHHELATYRDIPAN